MMRKKLTAWHPLYISLLRLVLPRQAFKVRSEVLLSQQPLRVDYVVVRRRLLPAPNDPGPLLTSRLFYEAELTLGEIKGPRDVLEARDFQWQLGYAAHLSALEEIRDPSKLQLMTVAGRLSPPFREQALAYGAAFVELEPGLHLARGPLHRHLVVETEVVADPLLRLFSQASLRRPESLWAELLTTEQRAILVQLCSDVEQFRRKPQLRMRYADYEEVAMSLEESIEKLLKILSAEERMKGLPAEERMKGLPAEERMKGLPAEERMKGLPVEERVKGLSTEELLRGLSAEQRELLRQQLGMTKTDPV